MYYIFNQIELEMNRSYFKFLLIFGEINSSFRAEFEPIKLFTSQSSNLKLKSQSNSNQNIFNRVRTKPDSVRLGYDPIQHISNNLQSITRIVKHIII